MTMKNVILYIVCAVFLANTLVVSAAFKPCAQGNGHDSMQVSMSQEADQPCHEDETPVSEQHCFDACFCPAYSGNHTPMFELDGFQILALQDMQFAEFDQHFISKSSSPLFRPPISLS